MAVYTQIDNPELFFQTKLYTGNDGTNAITLDGSENMQPDWVWIKSRNHTYSHSLFDSVRGIKKELNSNGQAAEENENDMLQLFNSDGFTLGSAGGVNNSSYNYASWNWKAGGSSSSNSDGSVTSTVSASTASGFSIARFTGTGSNLTIGHGLGVKPDFIILKCTSSSSTDWTCYHSSLGATKRLKLNVNDAASTNSTTWQDTEPTTSVISIGTSGDVNVSSGTHIVYSFANKQGAVKCGSYVGNANADGPFVYTGFKPAWLMVKGDRADGWQIMDNKREGYNVISPRLLANDSASEYTNLTNCDFLSNGFKVRSDDSHMNYAEDYFYIAFAESPFVNSNGVPNNAR
tara:strand:- start:33 stop:1073 length:1041 start_codon:yes stop_codon:yes gene_type:complete